MEYSINRLLKYTNIVNIYFFFKLYIYINEYKYVYFINSIFINSNLFTYI